MTSTTLSFHVDCDNLFVYEGEYGFKPSELGSLMYEQALPSLLEILESHAIRATFFVIGRELDQPACRGFCKIALARGHRIGNHTFHHRADFAKLPDRDKVAEIEQAHRALTEACGSAPIGFRAPGYYVDGTVIRALMAAGYLYDTSVLPGWSGLLMKAYLTLRAGTSDKVFGRWPYLLASRRPHTIGRSLGRGLLEFPISTFPFLRLPIHTTFVYRFGLPYLKTAFKLLRSIQGHHVYLLHAIDCLNYPRQADGLASVVVPLQWSYERRRELLHRICDLARPFDTILTEELAEAAGPGSFPVSQLLERIGRERGATEPG